MSFAINTDKDKEVISAILEYAKKNFVMKESGVRRADRDDLWRQVGSQHKAKYRRHLFKIIKSFENEALPPWAQNPSLTNLYQEAKTFQLRYKKHLEKASPANDETRTSTRKRKADSSDNKVEEKPKKKETIEEQSPEEEEQEDEQEVFVDINTPDDDTPIDPEQNAGVVQNAEGIALAGILYVRDAISNLLPK